MKFAEEDISTVGALKVLVGKNTKAFSLQNALFFYLRNNCISLNNYVLFERISSSYMSIYLN